MAASQTSLRLEARSSWFNIWGHDPGVHQLRHISWCLSRVTCFIAYAGGYNRERAITALKEGHADLITFVRVCLANPDLPRRFCEQAPLNKYDRSTFYAGGDKGYLDYALLSESALDQSAQPQSALHHPDEPQTDKPLSASPQVVAA